MRAIRWDITTLLGLTAVATALYLFWFLVGYHRGICYVSALVVVSLLGWWVRWLWHRVALRLTRFFAVAALFDLLLEGFVHPFHPETLAAKISCQLSLFVVYALYLFVLRPLDQTRCRAAVSP